MSVLGILITLFYLTLVMGIIKRWGIFEHHKIPKLWWLIAFGLKVAAGIAYMLLYKYEIGRGDILRFHDDGHYIFRQLKNDPALFVELCFGYYRDVPTHLLYHFDYGRALANEGIWWNMGSSQYLLVRLNALFNVFTLGNWSANLVIYNFLVFTGMSIGLKSLLKHLRDREKLAFVFFFLIPSTLLFLSGIHKDGIALALIGLVLYAMQSKRMKWWVILLLALAALYYVRSFLLMALLPLGFCYWIATIWREKRSKVFKAVFYAGLALVVLIPPPHSSVDLGRYLKEKQNFFLWEQGKYDVALPELTGSMLNALKKSPQAIWHFSFGQVQLEEGKLMGWLANGEMLALIIIFGFLVYRFKLFKLVHPPLIGLFLLFFCLLAFVGYGLVSDNVITNFRYKSGFLPLLFLAIMMMLEPKKNLN